MPHHTPRIAGAGIACLDHIVLAPQVPWGDTASVSGYSVQGGGLVATALVACARLGAECDLFSLLGDDQTGKQILDELRTEGVRASGVARVEGGGSPFSFIVVDEVSGERTIFHRSGAGLAAKAPSIDLSPIAGADVLLIDDIYPELALAAAKLARENSVAVVADLIPDPANAGLLRYVDVAIAPRHFARRIGCEDDLSAALAAIHAYGPATAVITLGAQGWIYSDATGRGRGGTFDVDVVDTTGAGDTFHGAFAYGLARGWDTAGCCNFASAVASIKCTMPGGRTGLPTLARATEFLRERNALDGLVGLE